MNWARVKTILIFVFLAVNIFLIFKVVEKSSRNELTPEEISALKNILSQNKIDLKTDIPSKIKFFPRMKITNKAIDEKAIADKILGKGKWRQEYDHNKNLIYAGDGREVSFDRYGFLTLNIRADKNEVLKLDSQDSVEKKVLGLVKNYLPIDKYTADFYSQNEKEIVIIFSFFDNGNDVFNNNLAAKILPEGKIIIKHGSVEENGFSAKNKQVKVVDAVVELVRNVRDTGKTTINEISIGYYADLNKGNEIIKSGEADPAWKIRTNKGIYIFDGYSGAFLYKFDTANIN